MSTKLGTPDQAGRRRRPGLGWLLGLALVCMAGPLSAAGERPLLVFVSVVPQQTFVERIGGSAVRVQPMVRPGQSPHTYEPTPRQVAELAAADLYVRVGVPFEDAWLPRISASSPGLKVVDVRQGIELLTEDPEHGDHDHGGDGRDSHIWTSPPLVKRMGAQIRDALSALRPDQAAMFGANYDRFAADLDALDSEIRARLAPLKDRHFLVFHPAWGYFADTYGLTQIPIEYRGKEPGARALAAAIDQARAAGIRVVLVQPQFSPRTAEQVAAAIGGRVEAVDPLSADYFATLRRLAGLIADSGHR